MQKFEKHLAADLFDKIPSGSNIAIYGANDVSCKIYKDIILKRADVNVVCFVEKQTTEDFENKKVYSIKEFLDKNLAVDLVIMTVSGDNFAENIFDIYDVPFFVITNFISDYYMDKHKILNDENYERVINIFEEESDKTLFDIIFRRRKRIDDDCYLAKYYSEHYKNNLSVNRTIKNQYLDKINKNDVQIMLDLGFNSGFNAIAYNKLLPNLKMIYAFEAIYDICKDVFVEDFIAKDKLTIIKSAVGESKSKTKFYINNSNPNASMTTFSNSMKDKHITDSTHNIIDVDVITIDDYCKVNNIKPDFIKMDIEGAELPAIIGGLDTIKNNRPQMAISIYHCDSDFINIPKYLYQNLDGYTYKLGQYSPDINETVLYALPEICY